MPNLTPSAIVKNPSKFVDFEKILGKEPIIKTKKDFVDAVLSIPPDKENLIPDDVAEWIENETQTDISITEPKTTTSSKGVNIWRFLTSLKRGRILAQISVKNLLKNMGRKPVMQEIFLHTSVIP